VTRNEIIDARIVFWSAIIKLTQFAWDNDLIIIGYWLFRNRKVQAWLVVRSLSRTMNSWHLKALALDFQMIDKDGNEVKDGNDPRWLLLGEEWESYGGIWGGRWDISNKPGKQPDSGHMQWSQKMMEV